MVEAFLPKWEKTSFRTILKKQVKPTWVEKPTAENVRYRKVTKPNNTQTMASAAEKPHRPRIIKPKKRQNYRILDPKVLLVPLALGTSQIASSQPEIEHYSTENEEKSTTSPRNIKPYTESLLNSNHEPGPTLTACSLSQYPREEKVKANPEKERSDAFLSWKKTSLTIDASTETLAHGSKSSLSVHSQSFIPRSKSSLNVESPHGCPSLTHGATEFHASAPLKTLH